MILSRNVCLAFTLLLFAGCSDPPPQLPPPPDNTYRIYSSFPAKGRAARQSLQIVHAIDLAIQQYSSNARFISIEHIKLDGSFEESGNWSSDAELHNALVASNDPTALAYIGPYNSAGAAASLPITNRAGLLQIGVSHTWPGLTMPGWDDGEPDLYRPSDRNSYVRMSVPDTTQAEAAAQWASDLGVHTMVTLTDGSSYSQGLNERFRRAAGDAGISITGALEIGMDGLEVVTSAIGHLRPDGLFYAPSSTKQAVTFAQAVEGVESRVRIFATDTALDDKFAAPTNVDGDLWHIVSNSTIELPPSTQATTFRLEYQAAYGDEPGLYAANAYDATKLVLDAVSASKVISRGNISEAVRGTVAYPGASGPVSFSESGDRHGWRVNGYQVKDGLIVVDQVLVFRP